MSHCVNTYVVLKPSSRKEHFFLLLLSLDETVHTLFLEMYFTHSGLCSQKVYSVDVGVVLNLETTSLQTSHATLLMFYKK